MTPIHLISPVDSSTYVTRMPLTRDAAFAAAASAKVAQKAWAARPLSERIALVKAGVAALIAKKDLLVDELAWQMGRPTRFGGEFGGVNDSPYGLTASVWTDDYDTAAALGQQIETGTVFMNRADYLDPALCWTGCKDTGRGGSLSYLGFHSVTRPKSYHLKKV